MRKIRTSLLMLAAFSAGCVTSAHHSTIQQNPTPAAEDPAVLCSRVNEIKSIPFKDEWVKDATYNALMDAGEKVVPCLIDQITNSTRMHDPRSIPGPTDTRVGDVAFFVLLRITKVEFESMLPPELTKKLPEEGVYAYHAWVDEENNRQWLQSRWRDWYRHKHEAQQRNNAVAAP